MTADKSENFGNRVVIVGGGFGGLAAARALEEAAVEIVLIDRANHHLFQPLLYQVATAALSPGDIAWPLRTLFRSQKNIRVVLADVRKIDRIAQRVELVDGEPIPYDRLILAPGARHSYFGHAEWEADAPGLKTLPDALELFSFGDFSLFVIEPGQWVSFAVVVVAGILTFLPINFIHPVRVVRLKTGWPGAAPVSPFVQTRPLRGGAAAVAGVRLGGLASPVTVHLLGGDLVIAVDDDLEVTMTGAAEEIYRGELSPDLAHALEEL